MLLTNEVEIYLSSNAKRYEELGYDIPRYIDKKGRNSIKRGTKILVNISDLPKGSKVKIKVLCDYCLVNIREIPYVEYINHCENNITHKYACKKCTGDKIIESNILNYGTSSIKIRSQMQGFNIGRNKLDVNIINKYFIIKDYLPQFSANDYEGSIQKLPYICLKHIYFGVQYVTYSNLIGKNNNCKCCSNSAKSGENSPSWKGGISSEGDVIRHSEEYKIWREEVFQRDNYTCQCCRGNLGHNLCAHHINNFSSNKELRFDINNGITLCNECHNPRALGSFHNIYGTRNNTIEQLKEYILRHNSEFMELKNIS